MLKPSQLRILIPGNHWTPFRNEIFEKEWGRLEQDHAAALYAILYDRSYHHSPNIMKTSLTNLLTWSHIGEDELGASLRELQDRKLVTLEKISGSHGSSSKFRLKVPLAAKVELTGGGWTPIPRFLIREYIPAYPDSVLLLLLLHYQHLRWQNDAYPSLKTLADKIRWSHSRVSNAIGTMSDADRWKKIRADLPRALTSELRPYRNGHATHYHLRAVRYEVNKGVRTMRLRKSALEKFDIPAPSVESSRTPRDNDYSPSWPTLEEYTARLKQKK